MKTGERGHAEYSFQPFHPGNQYRLHSQNDKAGKAEASRYFVNQKVRTVKTQRCYQQQRSQDNSYVEDYQHYTVKHNYFSPHVYCLIESRIIEYRHFVQLNVQNILSMIRGGQMLVNASSSGRGKWEETLLLGSPLPRQLLSGRFLGSLRPH